MIVRDLFEGTNAAFEGDRQLLLSSLPAGAQVTKAVVSIAPVEPPGGNLFEETISFDGASGAWGATKLSGQNFVEVDFHARRTLARVDQPAANLNNAFLFVDIGGLYVQINQGGALLVPDDPLGEFELAVDGAPSDGTLPGLTVSKFKLAFLPPLPANPVLDVERVSIRSTPSNLTLSLGQQPPFWARPGELARAESCPDFTIVLNTFLAEAEIKDGFYQIPMTVHSDTIARLDVSVEIEYVQEESVLPGGLDEATLPYDYSSLPKSEAGLLQVALPVGARVLPKLTTARVRGSFENNRIVYGPTGRFVPAGSVPVTPARSQATPLRFEQALAVSAVDLLLAARTRSASLAINLLEDIDGKPWTQPLLPEPAVITIDSAPSDGAPSDGAVAAKPVWIHAPLPIEMQFKPGVRYWLMVQSLSGEAEWSVASSAQVQSGAAAGAWTFGAGVGADPAGMQFTADGGLSWRAASSPAVAGPLAAFLHLRQPSGRFQVPIHLQVGEGEAARRVSLDRFQPLGRVDFDLGFEEVAAAINQYLDSAGQAIQSQGELLLNGELEDWLGVGDRVGNRLEVQVENRPTALQVSPDGSVLYAGTTGPSPAASTGLDFARLEAIDAACGNFLGEILFEAEVVTAITVSPNGSRACVVVEPSIEPGFGAHSLRWIDTATLRQVGSPINFVDTHIIQSAHKPAFSPSGNRLYVARMLPDTGFSGTSNSFVLNGVVQALDTTTLESVFSGKKTLDEAAQAIFTIGEDQEVTALAVSPDGSKLYTVVSGPNVEEAGFVRTFNTATRQVVGEDIPVGVAPVSISVSADGRRAIVLSRQDSSLSVLNLERGAPEGPPIELEDRLELFGTAAAVLSPDGSRAYIVASASNENPLLAVVDIRRRYTLQSIGLPTQASDVAVSPQGDRIFVADESFDTGTQERSLSAFPVGVQVPSEWTLTSGFTYPLCAPVPYQRAAVLGDFLDPEKPNPLPSALSQVTPVIGETPYLLNYWGMASDPEAVAEVFWLGSECGLLQSERLPFTALEGQSGQVKSVLGNAIQQGRLEAAGDFLVLHRLAMTSPPGASLAEVRFTVPPNEAAVFDRVSLMANPGSLTNGDFQQQEQGRLSGWSIVPPGVAGITVTLSDDTAEVRNGGLQPLALEQTAPFEAGKPFSLVFEGRIAESPALGTGPRIELSWLDASGAVTGAPSVMEHRADQSDRQVVNGTAPDAAEKARISLLLPPGTAISVKRISLEAPALIQVPLSFISAEPGELVVSDLRVVYEIPPAAAPTRTPGSLCTATPPGRQPGGQADDCCRCPHCQKEQDLHDAEPAETRGGQPARAMECTNCGARLLIPGGASPAALRAAREERRAQPQPAGPPVTRLAPLALLPPPVRRATAAPVQPIVLEAEARLFAAVELPPVTAVHHIGPAREKILIERGLGSVDRLAAARPADLIDFVPQETALEIIASARRIRNLAMTRRKLRRS